MNPTFDHALYRQALGQFATGVTVISFVRQGEPQGMTVNSFTSVSLEPPLVLFCPALTTRFALEAEVGETFTVSILAADQKPVCAHFAGGPKLASVPWKASDHSPPSVAESVAWLHCRTVAIHEHGDHLVVVGEVQDFGSDQDSRPLLFFRGKYPTMS